MARERWYWVDRRHNQLMQHSENDGWAYLRNGPCDAETPIDVDQLGRWQLTDVLRELVAPDANELDTSTDAELRQTLKDYCDGR